MHFVEFYNANFLLANYIVAKPSAALEEVVDFFWMSQYGHQDPFCVTTFPRNGSSLLFNLGSHFQVQKKNKKIKVNDTAFYLRNTAITSFHQADNVIFGVQFKVNLPVLSGMVNGQEKMRNDITSGIFNSFVDRLMQCNSFPGRILLTEEMLLSFVSEKLFRKARLVNIIVNEYMADLSQLPNAANLSELVNASPKTIERYFVDCLGTSPRQALKNIRIRNAMSAYIDNKKKFNYASFGYFDESHFYKDLRPLQLFRRLVQN
jgi:AraC-like DNA-binding protein